MACSASAIWDEQYLRYDFGEHPLSPVRLDLTIRLARSLGVLDRLEVIQPVAADEQQLLTIHDADYLAAVREASTTRTMRATDSAPRTTRCSPACTTRRR